MYVRVITPATVEPITLVEAKDHLRVDGDDENDLIEDLIVSAREQIETGTHRQLLTATLELILDRFPGTGQYLEARGDYRYCPDPLRAQLIEIPRPPLQSIESVQYIDLAGVQQTLDPTLYQVDLAREPGRILPSFGTVWPLAREVLNAVTITFVAGWTPQTLPRRIKSLTRLLVANAYENREPVGTIQDAEMPLAVRTLMWQTRWGSLT